MIGLTAIWRNCTAAAAAEMALVTPLLLIILVGSVETGNYFLSEHVLIKGLRDGARYAARQGFTNYSTCSGQVPTPGTAGSPFENTKLLVRKGSLNSADADRLPNWTAGTTAFNVTMTCPKQPNGQDYQGIYRNSTGASTSPVVLVTASVPYRPVMPVFGVSSLGLKLNGRQQASVMGI